MSSSVSRRGGKGDDENGRRLVLVALMVLAGFASANVAMVHLKTGDVRFCEAVGTGWGGAPLALIHVSNCVKQHKALGYRRADSLSDAERAALRPELRKFKFKGEIKNR